MIRTIMTTATLFMLAGCDSGSFSEQFGAPSGAASAFGATLAVPTDAGSFAGVAASDTTVVQDAAGNGYALAYGNVNAADFGNGSGRANLAIAGLLPGTDLGTTPATGNALMTGTYQIVRVANANAATDPTLWKVTRPMGNLNATIDFAAGRLTGQSDDGALTLTASGDAGFSKGFAGDATYAGTAGKFVGQLGPVNAVATLTGQGADTFFAGGFAIGQ